LLELRLAGARMSSVITSEGRLLERSGQVMLRSMIGLPGSRQVPQPEPRNEWVAVCAQCGGASDAEWYGWGAYRADEREFGEPPRLAFYCPACAESEFGRHPRRPRSWEAKVHQLVVLELEERQVSAKRRKLHERLANIPNGEIDAREREISRYRRQLHQLIDSLRAELEPRGWRDG
jgi:hypothetical protein